VSWPTDKPAIVHGFIPRTSVVLTSSPWPAFGGHAGWSLGPLVARDVATGAVRPWSPDDERLTLVDPGTDGRHVLIGRVVSGRTRLFLLDAAGGAVVAELPRGSLPGENDEEHPPSKYEQIAAFGPDGRQVVYLDRGDGGEWLRVWDSETRREIAAVPDAISPMAWSPDGRTVAYTYHVHGLHLWSVRLWEVAANETRPIGPAIPFNAEPLQMAFSPDGKMLVSVLACPRDGRPRPRKCNDLVGWDVATGSERYRLETICADFLPGLSSFVTWEVSPRPRAMTARRCDFGAGTELWELDHDVSKGWGGLGYSPDGRQMLASRRNSNVVLEFLDGHFSPPGQFVHKRPQLEDTESGRLLDSLPMELSNGFTILATSHAWSRDQTLLAVAGNDTLAVWDMPPRKPLSWIALGVALVALPLIVFTRRRGGRQRKETAA
jgi:WD40 repeat protein